MLGHGCQNKNYEQRRLLKAVVKDAVGTLYGPLCLGRIAEGRY